MKTQSGRGVRTLALPNPLMLVPHEMTNMVGLLVALSVMREDTVGGGSSLGGEGGKEGDVV